MIRHPAAFAGSLKKKGWAFPFEDLLSQSELMEEKLSHYRDEIEHFAHHKQDVVDQAALLWKILYDVVAEYKEQFPDWTFVRHEDIARNPMHEFELLFERFGLVFTEDVRKYVAYHSGQKTERPKDVAGSHLTRDSQSVIYNWKQRLTMDEIKRVRDRVQPVAKQFYDDADWQP